MTHGLVTRGHVLEVKFGRSLQREERWRESGKCVARLLKEFSRTQSMVHAGKEGKRMEGINWRDTVLKTGLNTSHAHAIAGKVQARRSGEIHLQKLRSVGAVYKEDGGAENNGLRSNTEGCFTAGGKHVKTKETSGGETCMHRFESGEPMHGEESACRSTISGTWCAGARLKRDACMPETRIACVHDMRVRVKLTA
jgi:hypothetical protein